MDTRKILSFLVVIFCLHYVNARTLHKRAAFYIANETACVVDNIVYYNGDPIPTDDPCEACRCRPPGFACVLRECEVKPGCRAVRRSGHCCPEYVCDTTEPQPEIVSDDILRIVPTEVAEISKTTEVVEAIKIDDDTTDLLPLPNEVRSEEKDPTIEEDKSLTTTTETVAKQPKPPKLDPEKPLVDVTSLFYIPKEGKDEENLKPTEESTTVEQETTSVKSEPEVFEKKEVLLKSESVLTDDIIVPVEKVEESPVTETTKVLDETVTPEIHYDHDGHNHTYSKETKDDRVLLKHESLEESIVPATTQRIPDPDTTAEEKSTASVSKVTEKPEEPVKDTSVTGATTTKPLPIFLNSEISQPEESTKNVEIFTENNLQDETTSEISSKTTEIPTTEKEIQKLPELKNDEEALKPTEEIIEKDVKQPEEITSNVPDDGGTEPPRTGKVEEIDAKSVTDEATTAPIYSTTLNTIVPTNKEAEIAKPISDKLSEESTIKTPVEELQPIALPL